MAAKKKRAVKPPKEDKKSSVEKTPETTETPTDTSSPLDVAKAGITSFSQVDTKEESSEEVVKPPKEKEEVKSQEPTEVTSDKPVEKEEVKPPDKVAKEAVEEKEKEPEAESESKEGINKKLLVGAVFAVLLLGILAGGIYYFKSKVSDKAPTRPEEVAKATSTPEPTQTPTPEPEIVLADYSLSVLNGSGVVGEADKVKDILASAGFEEIETDNADSYDYTNTEVSFKKDTPEGVYEAIKKALEDDYEVVKSEVYLSEDASFDVIVIVGTKKAE